MRLMIIGTHPYQTTGYSKVMYNMIKELKTYKDISVSIFGIQKFTDVNDSERSDVEADNVLLWDVYGNDKEDFGFGTKSLKNFITINQPHIIMIYNDPNVVEKYLQNLYLVENRKFKIIIYLDQLYNYQHKTKLEYICEKSDHIFCFTDYWLQNLLEYNKKDNKSVMKHGLATENFQIIDAKKCKKISSFQEDDFIFLNLNRNQPRKRLELTIIGFVKFLKEIKPNNAYLLFGNVRDEKGVDIEKVYQYELKQAGLDSNYDKFLKIVPKTQILTDKEVNILYNACDVGINTCEAEGFGLCSYEHALLGKPQIVSNLGGLKDFFNDTNSLLCQPVSRIFSDNGGDLNGDGMIVSTEDIKDNMIRYYKDKELYSKHSRECVKIKDGYKWHIEVEKMVKVLKTL